MDSKDSTWFARSSTTSLYATWQCLWWMGMSAARRFCNSTMTKTFSFKITVKQSIVLIWLLALLLLISKSMTKLSVLDSILSYNLHLIHKIYRKPYLLNCLKTSNKKDWIIKTKLSIKIKIWITSKNLLKLNKN